MPSARAVAVPAACTLAALLTVTAVRAGGLTNPFLTLPWLQLGEPDDELFGSSVAPAGDVNGDGRGDLLVGFGTEGEDQIRAQLFLGSPEGLGNDPAWTWITSQAAGASVAPGGDLNGDGYGDVLVGQPYWDTPSHVDAGRVAVFHGGPAGLPPVPTYELFSPLPAAQQQFGFAVDTAGDVNGDDYADVVVGARGYASGGFASRGAAFVFHGGPGGLASTPARNLIGPADNGEFGATVATAGDINADGFGDLVIGARSASTVFDRAGSVAIHLGSATGVLAVADTVIHGTAALAFCGSSVSTAGDVDGDDHADVLIGIPGLNGNAGKVDLLFGGPGGVASSLTVPDPQSGPFERFGSVVAPLGDLDADGYADFGARASNSSTTGRISVYRGGPSQITYVGEVLPPSPGAAVFGYALSTSGDADGDGFSEIVVADPFATTSGPNEGRVEVFALPRRALQLAGGWPVAGPQPGTRFGSALALLPWSGVTGFPNLAIGDPVHDGFGRVALHSGTSTGIVPKGFGFISGTANAQALGARVVDVGDLNRDGLSDYAVSSPGHDNGFVSQVGRVDFHAGDIFLVAPPVLVVAGERDFDRVGSALAGRGDVNGDGFHDLLVGAREWDSAQFADCGKVWLHYGGPGGPAGVPWTREGAAGQGLGAGVALGDLDADGYSDVIVGSSSPVGIGSGRVEVYYGGPGGLAGTPGLVIHPAGPNPSFGQTVVSLGDVNADGICDLGVGAPLENGTGHAYVYEGTRGRSQSGVPIFHRAGTQAGGRFGEAMAGGGDLDGDGWGDLVFGEPGWDGGQVDEGRLHVHYGAPELPEAIAGFTFEPDLLGAELGASFAPLLDVNRDGFADLVAGAPGSAGRVYPFLGGGGAGRRFELIVREPQAGFPRRFHPAGLDHSTLVGTGMFLRSPAAGRIRVTYQMELALHNEGFSGSPTHVTFAWYDTGPSGSTPEIFPQLGHSMPGRGFVVRGRFVSRSPYFPRTRWVRAEAHASGDLDVRAAGAVVEAHPLETGGTRRVAVSPNPARRVLSARIAFSLPAARRATVDVFDVRGAHVRRLAEGMFPAGPSTVSWDARDASGRAVPAGVYFVALTSGAESDRARVVLLP